MGAVSPAHSCGLSDRFRLGTIGTGRLIRGFGGGQSCDTIMIDTATLATSTANTAAQREHAACVGPECGMDHDTSPSLDHFMQQLELLRELPSHSRAVP